MLYTEETNALLNGAIDSIIEKYINSGGDTTQMMTRNQLMYFFEGLFYREGEEGVKKFIDNYKYTPTPKTFRGYA